MTLGLDLSLSKGQFIEIHPDLPLRLGPRRDLRRRELLLQLFLDASPVRLGGIVHTLRSSPFYSFTIH